MKQEQIRQVFNNENIQQLILKSEILFNTADYKLLGKQLNFEALKDIVKQAKQQTNATKITKSLTVESLNADQQMQRDSLI